MRDLVAEPSTAPAGCDTESLPWGPGEESSQQGRHGVLKYPLRSWHVHTPQAGWGYGNLDHVAILNQAECRV